MGCTAFSARLAGVSTTGTECDQRRPGSGAVRDGMRLSQYEVLAEPRLQLSVPLVPGVHVPDLQTQACAMATTLPNAAARPGSWELEGLGVRRLEEKAM
jgi:hypothetical protein